MAPVDDSDVYFTALSRVGMLLGIGSSIKNIFGLGAPSFPSAEEIAAAVRKQVQQVFFEGTVDDKIVTASAALAAAQQFLDVDYQNASDQTNAQKWTLLDASSTSPGLNQLTATALALETWIGEAENNNEDALACRAGPVVLGLYIFICLYHHERSLVAGDTKTANDELKDMRDKARLAIANMTPHLTSMMTKRQGCLNYAQDALSVTPLVQPCVGDTFTDDWYDGRGQNVLYGWGNTMDGSSRGTPYRLPLRAVMHATSRLLFTGAKADADWLWSTLESDWLRQAAFMNGHDYRDDFRGLTFTANWDFGKWAANMRDLLTKLDVVATSIPGTGQDQWCGCNSCGMLYFSGAPSWCPRPGPFGPMHMASSSPNFVLHCDSPTPPSDVQTNWFWCNQCGGLHLGDGASLCSKTGGPHSKSGSGNYAVVISPANYTGFATVQDNWRWCRNCGVLHHPLDSGCCPGNPFGPTFGPHDTTGSGNYQLAYLGNTVWVLPL